MLIEFHLTTAKLLALLLSRVRSQTFCVTDEFSIGGATHVLDHVEFLDGPSIERVAAKATIHVPNAADQQIDATVVRYVQPVTLFATKISTLAAHNDAASPPDKAPTITLFFDLTMTVQAGVPRFRVKFNSVDAGILDALAPGTSQLIQSKIDFDVQSDMDLSAIETLLGTSVTATNAGMVVDGGAGRVVMRIEVNSAANAVNAWSTFFNGAVANVLGGNDWGLMVDKDLIVPVVVSRVAAGLQDAASFSLESGPSGAWSFVAGPRVNVSFSGEVIDACTCLWGEIDVDVDVEMGVKLSVPTSNVLRMTGTMDWDLDNAEVFCCALTAAMFWPAVGTVMLANEDVDWLSFLGGLALGPLAVFIGVIAKASSTTPDFDAGGTCQKLSDTEIQCDEPVSINAGLGSLTLTGVSGLPSGPLLSGTLFTGPAFGHGVLKTEVSPFAWAINGSCNQGFHPGNTAGVFLTNIGNAPIEVCEVKVLDDPLGAYSATVSDGGQQPSWVVGAISIAPDLSPAFLLNSYPCKLLIKTSGGARLITIAAPSAISDEELQQMQLEAIGMKVNCYQAVDSFWAATHRFNPKWHVDPPVDEIVAHLWQVLIGGLQPGDRILAHDVLGLTIAATAADGDGVARLSAWTTPSAGDQELTLVQAGGPLVSAMMASARTQPAQDARRLHLGPPSLAVGAIDERRRILIKEVTLIRRATLPLYGRCERIEGGRLRGMPSVVAVTADAVRVFDIHTSADPSLAQMIRGGGLRGAMIWNDSLVVWGESGVASFASGESCVLSPPERAKRPIRDVVRMGSRLAVHTESGVEFLSSDLSVAPEHSAPKTRLKAITRELVREQSNVLSPTINAAVAFVRIGRTVARVDPGARTIGLYDVARTYET